MAQEFLTVPEELLGVAEALIAHFEESGYSVAVEDQSRSDYPYLPALRCRRGTTTLLVDVTDRMPSRDRLRQWRAFCLAQQRDTRYALGVSTTAALAQTDLTHLRSERIGLYTIDKAYSVHELVNPHDIALKLEPPALNDYSNRVRRALGPAWEELRRGNWREGFDAACVALETEVRKYLKRHLKSGRLTFQPGPGGRVRVLTDAQIDKMPMGALKDQLGTVSKPIHSDSVLFEVLKSLNPDRILIAHKRQEAKAEARLRTRVQTQLWSIVRGVEQAVK